MEIGFSVSLKQISLLFIFFGVISLAAFASIASNDYLPNSWDLANHLVGIVQAKTAMDQGQFPIRVLSVLNQHGSYPYFQFYSPLAYMIGGWVYKFFSPQNPFIAYKISLWFAMIFAGFCMMYLTMLFTKSLPAGVLSAVLYLMSPYLLIDIGVQGFFPETLAICFLPCLLCLCVQLQRTGSLFYFIMCACAWSALAMLHSITFVTTSFFAGLWMVLMNIQETIPAQRLMFLLTAYLLGLVLTCWFLAPILLLEPYLYVHHTLSNPFYTNWLTPISTLLSPHAISPIPLPGNGLMYFPFYVSAGWIVLLSAGIMCIHKTKAAARSLLFLFFLALLLTWSPINFWVYLPNFFKIVQFGSRFLIHLMWIGSLLFAYAIIALFGDKLETKHVVIGILLIGLANGSWLMTNQSSSKSLSELIKFPQFYRWGSNAYIMSPLLRKEKYPAVDLNAAETSQFCEQTATQTRCDFHFQKTKLIQLPYLFYPNMVEVKLDGTRVPYFAVPKKKLDLTRSVSKETVLDTNPLLVGMELPAGRHIVELNFTGLQWANKVSLAAWIFVLFLALYCAARQFSYLYLPARYKHPQR